MEDTKELSRKKGKALLDSGGGWIGKEEPSPQELSNSGQGVSINYSVQ